MLEEVVVPSRRNVNGELYGFVRCSNASDVSKLLKAVNYVCFGNFSVKEGVARFDRAAAKEVEKVGEGARDGEEEKGVLVKGVGDGKKVVGEGEKRVAEGVVQDGKKVVGEGEKIVSMGVVQDGRTRGGEGEKSVIVGKVKGGGGGYGGGESGSDGGGEGWGGRLEKGKGNGKEVGGGKKDKGNLVGGQIHVRRQPSIQKLV